MIIWWMKIWWSWNYRYLSSMVVSLIISTSQQRGLSPIEETSKSMVVVKRIFYLLGQDLVETDSVIYPFQLHILLILLPMILILMIFHPPPYSISSTHSSFSKSTPFSNLFSRSVQVQSSLSLSNRGRMMKLWHHHHQKIEILRMCSLGSSHSKIQIDRGKMEELSVYQLNHLIENIPSSFDLISISSSIHILSVSSCWYVLLLVSYSNSYSNSYSVQSNLSNLVPIKIGVIRKSSSAV